MRRVIDESGCKEVGPLSEEESSLDNRRSNFILRRKLRVLAGRRRLGMAWLVLDPIVIALVYLFVFTVVRSRPSLESILIGIGLFRIFQTSVKSGTNSIKDFSGGLTSERVRTRVLVSSMIKYRILDNSLQSSGIALILLVWFDVPITGVLVFLMAAQALGILGEGFGLNLSTAVRKLPDLSNLVNHFLLFMFFASPVLYPMEKMEGLHYKANEYNPFAFFAEGTRHYTDNPSVFLDLSPEVGTMILLTLLILTFRGISSLDRQRWEVSSWS